MLQISDCGVKMQSLMCKKQFLWRFCTFYLRICGKSSTFAALLILTHGKMWPPRFFG